MPPRTEGEELVHSLRNILAAMTYGMRALQNAPPGGKGQEINDIQQALIKQIDQLEDAVAEAARLLESPHSGAASSR